MYVCVCVLSLFGRTKKFQPLPEMSHTIPDQQSNTCPFCSHSVTQLPFGVAALHTGSRPFYAQSPDLNQSLIRSHASSSLSPATCKSFACIASVTLLFCCMSRTGSQRNHRSQSRFYLQFCSTFPLSSYVFTQLSLPVCNEPFKFGVLQRQQCY